MTWKNVRISTKFMLMKLDLVFESHLVKKVKELKNSRTLFVPTKVLKTLPEVINAKGRRKFVKES